MEIDLLFGCSRVKEVLPRRRQHPGAVFVLQFSHDIVAGAIGSFHELGEVAG
jgi:hypothetical protein